MDYCRQLIILEGPDGAGKTTLAKILTEVLGAHYVHFGPLPKVRYGLARLYVEAMLRALWGDTPVVMDRCWLSEPIYGQVFRQNEDRVGLKRRLLERLAMRCEVLVIQCTTNNAVMETNFLSGRPEYLANVEQHRQVVNLYTKMTTSLPVLKYDYQHDFTGSWHESIKMMSPHRITIRSAGNITSRVLLVGDRFTDIVDDVPLYQWPFGSLRNNGCSLWLANKLEKANIPENSLCWINQNDDLETFFTAHKFDHIFALGEMADNRLNELGIIHWTEHHPQWQMRFNSHEEYGLISKLKGLI